MLRLLLAPWVLLATVAAQPPADLGEASIWKQGPRIGLRVRFGLPATAPPSAPGSVVAPGGEAHGDAQARVRGFAARAFDAREWARIAKDAGAQVLVFPAKGSDGFCLFCSAATDFDVHESPHGRDMLRDVAFACRDEGLALGVAYSLIDGSRQQDPSPPAYAAYVEQQLQEIARHAPALLELDGAPPQLGPEALASIAAAVRGLVPRTLLAADRPAAAAFERAGVAVDAVLDPRGDDATKASAWVGLDAELAQASVDAAVAPVARALSRGRPVWLEVAPNGEGSFRAETIGKLRVLGEWLRRHAAAFRDTEPASPALDFAACTRGKGEPGTLYLVVFAPPRHGIVVVPGLPAGITAADLEGQPLACKPTPDGLEVRLPAEAGPAPVLVLHGAGGNGPSRRAP